MATMATNLSTDNIASQNASSVASQMNQQGFDQLATGLRTAMAEFEKTASPENINALFALIKPVADMGQRAWNGSVDYTRRHPVRVAVGVAALGLLVAGFAQSRRALKA